MSVGSELDSFIARYPAGSRVDTDGYPKNQPYQCVDPIKLYLHEVFGMPIQAYGNAVDYWSNPKILERFEQITDGSREDGDILVWGNDPGSFTGVEGHIGLSTGGKIYNQNYSNSGEISINNFFNEGYIGALREKGGDVSKITKEQEMVLSQGVVGYDPGANYNYQFTGKDSTQEVLDSMTSFWSAQAPTITKEMENAVADGISGVKNYIGKDYNSAFVGQKVVSHYPKMVDFWIGQKPTIDNGRYVPYDGQLYTKE